MEPNPFLESWFVLPSLRELDPEERVRLLRFECGGRLAGLMPLVREKRYYGKRIAHLAGWTHPNSFVGAPLIAPGHERKFWRHLFDWADQNAGTALFLHLSDIPLDGAIHEALETVLAEQGRPGGMVHSSERAMLQSKSTPEDYFTASLSSKERRELKRKLARLSEMGDLRFVHAHGDDGLDEWTDRFLELENAGWKGKAGSSLTAFECNEHLFRHAVAGAARRGKLERLSLTLDGRPIAMLSSFISLPGGFGFKCAFDETYRRYSPGMLLQCEHLMVLEHRQIAWFDSCADRANATVDRLWRERRRMGRFSVGIGGGLRKAMFRRLLAAEVQRADMPEAL